MKNFSGGLLLALSLFSASLVGDAPKEYVIGHLQGQAGNQFFQIATTSALAWDNGAEAFFPQLGSFPTEYRHYFSRCKVMPPSKAISYEWGEPGYRYHPITYQPGMKLSGYFQSWKYFDKYREKLVNLFAPTDRDQRYIEKKYGFLLKDEMVVGIQIRYYFDAPDVYPQYGKDYLEKAMALFPETATFVVSSNRINFAKDQVPINGRKVFFIENEQHHFEFYLLTRCHHNIITNSTFGWWSAFLNTHPDQIVVRPSYWMGLDTQDLCPEHWIKVDAEPMDISLLNGKY